jgi:hypothetical protein
MGKRFMTVPPGVAGTISDGAAQQQEKWRHYAGDRQGLAATSKASGEVKADSGGGFSFGSALRVASFAGQMYMGFATMGAMRGFGGGGLGMGMAMMNPMESVALSSGVGVMGGFVDPRAAAMTSMTMGFSGGTGGMNPGMYDPADQEIFQVATEAAGDVAAATTDALKRH